MAHKKGGGSSRNGRDSQGQRLGIKKFGGEYVISGNILVRQHGTKVHPGLECGTGSWIHTLCYNRRLRKIRNSRWRTQARSCGGTA